MFDIFKMSWMEYKKIFCKKSNRIVLLVVYVLLLFCLDEFFKTYANSDLEKYITTTNYFFSLLASFIIFFQSTTVFTDEFKFGTSSLIFSSIKSRTEIILSKIFAMILFSVTLALANFTLIYYCYNLCKTPVEYSYFGLLIFMYFVFSWFTANYFLLCSIIFKSRAVSFMFGLGIIFFLDDFCNVVLTRITSKISASKKLLKFIPFTDVFCFFDMTKLDIMQIYGMLCFGIIFFMIASVLLEKKDLI